jgi:peptide/nickel transport system substrate-binding protein
VGAKVASPTARARCAVAWGAAAVMLALSACGGGGPRAVNASATRTSLSIPGLKPGENALDEKLTGRRGGTLVADESAGFVNLDPGQAYYVLDYAVVYATQRPLFSYRPNALSTLSPDLASEMPTEANGGITDGGRTLTVHIRAGVHFSPPIDRAVTSSDVAYAIERAANPHVANPYFPGYFGWRAIAPLQGAQRRSYAGSPIPGIRTPNPTTIVFHTLRPSAAFLIQALSLPISAPVPESFAGPLDRHDPTTYGSEFLLATGPYMIRADARGRISRLGYRAGEFATLVRNPNWNPATDYRPAYLNRIDVHIGGAESVIGERVLRGSHLIELDPPAAAIVRQAYSDDPSQVTFTPGQGDHYVALDNAAGPMRNVNIRRALWAALDRTRLARAGGGPLLSQPMTHFIFPGVLGYDVAGGAAGPAVPYNLHPGGDVSLARRYMRAAGYPTGRYTGRAPIQVVAATGGSLPAQAEIVDRALRTLGFRTRVTELDQGTMYQRCSTPAQEVDACPSVGWVRDLADPETVLYPTFDGRQITGGGNWGQVNDPVINAAMQRAALTVDPTARPRAWAAVDRLLVDRAVAVPETFANAATIESADVAGVNAVWDAGIWDLDFTSLR